HLRLRDRCELLFGYGFFRPLRHQGLQHFSLDVLSKLAADQRNGRLATPESGYVREARELLGDTLDLFRHFFGGNFQFQLAAAARFGHTKVLSWDGDRFRDESSLVSTACAPIGGNGQARLVSRT